MENIVRVLMKENIDLVFSIDDYLKDNNPISIELSNLISNISDKSIDKYCTSKDKILYKHSNELYDLKKRTVIRVINVAIDKMRLNYLREFIKTPTPYCNFKDSKIYDEDFLIDISKFDIYNMCYKNDGYSYSVLPSRPEKNSMSFALRELIGISKQASVKLRLDPFMKKPNSEYRTMVHKMLIYGNPFSWEEIDNMVGTKDLKWQDEKYELENREITEMVWKKVGDEVHFICEELPRDNELDTRGSRYFHSIYIPKKEKVVHADGAIRIYTKEELDTRKKCHVKKIGKIGRRIKLFRADGEIDKDRWAKLVAAFFFMNDDIEKYYNSSK